MILLDGKQCAQNIIAGLKEKIAAIHKPLRLAVVVVGENPVIEKFVAQKRKIAKEIGVDFRIHRFDTDVAASDLRRRVAQIVHEKKNTGVIIQLPLPPHIGKQHMLNAIVPEKDVDALSSRSLGSIVAGKSPIISPVASAIRTLLDNYSISYHDKRIVIMGAGALVGKPVALWLLQEGIGYSLITKETSDSLALLKEADVIISGIGKPGFITGSMIKNGVVIIDAGTSEAGGKLVGDIDFESVSKKASFITPVPGGVGLVTVAKLYENLFELAKQQK